jgi:hypothetical protein
MFADGSGEADLMSLTHESYECELFGLVNVLAGLNLRHRVRGKAAVGDTALDGPSPSRARFLESFARLSECRASIERHRRRVS